MELNSVEIKEVLSYTFDNNIELAKEGIKPMSIKINGESGIGKTSVIRQVAEEKGFKYVKLNLAEITVDDLIGYPIIVHEMKKDNDTKWIPEKTVDTYIENGWELQGNYRMSYGTPEKLAPYIGKDTPIVLTLDDANRATMSLLQAVMEICEEGRYTSWELPKGSTVVLSCNPEDGDYIVTSTDDAHKTRTLSYDMKFDVDSWVSEFAERNGIPNTGINFIMQHPEVVTSTKDFDEKGQKIAKTNIRIWTKFFYTIKSIQDWSKNINLITKLAGTSIPEEHLIIFTNYVNNKLNMIPTSEEILNSKYEEMNKKLMEITRSSNGAIRSDIAAIICKRLMNYAVNNEEAVTKEQMANYTNFLLSDIFTEDLKFLTLRKLGKISKFAEGIIKHPEIAKMFIETM